MSTEDILYLLMLLLSIPLGHVVKISGSPARKQFLCTFFGILLAVILLGSGIWHSLITFSGTYVIIAILGQGRCEWVAFLYVFGYLFFFRTCTWFGFAKPPFYSNAFQLLVTLRCCTLPFEIFDPEIKGNSALLKKSQPSFYNSFSYCFCYVGIMTGPYYRYKTFMDCVHHENPQSISTVKPAVRKLKYLAPIGVIYLLCNTYFPIKHIGSDEYVHHPWGIVYQLAYLVPTFTGFRWRFYIGWLLAEACCITLGLGAYPFETDPKPGQGPTKPLLEANEDDNTKHNKKILNEDGDTHSFNTVYNIKIFDCEFSPYMRCIMKDWNMTVQWWIAVFVYRKLPFQNKNIRLTLTLLVSAFWHGVAPGYYLTFLMVPLIVIAETRMEKAIKPYLSARMCYFYDWFAWFWLYRFMEYVGCGFLLLQAYPVIAAWKSMHFIGHVIILLFIIIPVFIPKKKISGVKETKKHS